jgi:hypothetical protein
MNQNMPLRLIITITALVLASVHVWKPALEIDPTTIILLVLCVLPWLQPIVKTIELLGIKLELQELKGKVDEARGAAESASRKADLAKLSSDASLSEPAPSASSNVTSEGRISSLANEYDTIRNAQRSGDARTYAMTDVTRRMIEVAKGTDHFDVKPALQSSDRGQRLFAYAYLYARPDAAYLIELVNSVVEKEDKPFGQYWGLQSIGRLLSSVAVEMPLDVRVKLERFLTRVPAGTDREYELKRLLRAS